MSKPEGVNISGSVVPNDDTDAYSTQHEKWGTHSVVTRSVLDDVSNPANSMYHISSARRIWGMVCGVIGDAEPKNNGTYKLVYGKEDGEISNNNNWLRIDDGYVEKLVDGASVTLDMYLYPNRNFLLDTSLTALTINFSNLSYLQYFNLILKINTSSEFVLTIPNPSNTTNLIAAPVDEVVYDNQANTVTLSDPEGESFSWWDICFQRNSVDDATDFFLHKFVIKKLQS